MNPKARIIASRDNNIKKSLIGKSIVLESRDSKVILMSNSNIGINTGILKMLINVELLLAFDAIALIRVRIKEILILPSKIAIENQSNC